MAKEKTEMKLPGHAFANVQAERMVIGAILFNPAKAWAICRELNARNEWFTDRVCSYVFESIEVLTAQGQPIDTVMVSEQIRKMHGPDGIAVAQEFTLQQEEWIGACKSGKNVLQHLKILEDKWKRRDAAFYFEDGLEQLSQDGATDFIIGQVKHSLTKLHHLTAAPEMSMPDTMTMLEKSYADAQKKKGTGIPVPWDPLQRLISGLPKGKVTIVAARPKQGKSTLANNIGGFLAWEHNIPVGIWSMEMTKGEWISNMIGAKYGLDMSLFAAGLYTSEQYQVFQNAGKEMEFVPITIHDTPQTISSLCASIRDDVTEKKLECVVIDYLQLLRSDSNSRGMNRQQEVANWSNEICNLAKECQSTAFVLVSQLSRAGVQEGLKRPELHHLRDSGSLEQDAYMIVFVYQDPNAGDTPLPDNAPSIVEVAARRGGRTGCCSLVFQKSRQRFIV
jgi:replicative DNA helicase